MGSQRVRHDLAINQQQIISNTKKKNTKIELHTLLLSMWGSTYLVCANTITKYYSITFAHCNPENKTKGNSYEGEFGNTEQNCPQIRRKYLQVIGLRWGSLRW